MLLDLLVPVRCPVCRRPGAAPCAACALTLPVAVPAARPPGLASLHAAFAYEGAARPVIAALKYRGTRQVAQYLGLVLASMVAAIEQLSVASNGPRWVTWAPTSPARRRQRGFDQAQLLAEVVARELGLELVPALQRTGGGHQTGQARAQRLRADLVFVPVRSRAGPVLLIDDVCTTGATLCAAANALRRGGSGPVHGLVAARTP